MSFLYWIPAVFWAGLIFYLSSIPNLQSGLEQDFILRKLAHVFEYFVLALLVAFGILKGKINNLTKKKAITIFILTFLYAVSDEIHQSFVPTRNGSFKDVLIDSFGILLAVFVLFYKFKLASRAKNQ